MLLGSSFRAERPQKQERIINAACHKVAVETLGCFISHCTSTLFGQRNANRADALRRTSVELDFISSSKSQHLTFY